MQLHPQLVGTLASETTGFQALGSEETWRIFKVMLPEPEKYFRNFPISTFLLLSKNCLENPYVNVYTLSENAHFQKRK